MNVLFSMGACALGYGLGHWIRPRDFAASFWGIGFALAVAYATSQNNPWYLASLPFFTFFLFQRKK